MEENLELRLSFFVVLLLAAVYIVYELLAIPAGGHPFGHSLGVLGATLMVMTEVLYSARKRLPFFNAGRMRNWLAFHIFTGITGPALVLMHTGLEFRGLAGLTMLLTALVVASGFLGRYIYTAVPRNLAGAEVDRRALEAEVARQQERLQAWSAGKSARIRALAAQESALAAATAADAGLLEVLGRRFYEWRERRRLRAALRGLQAEEQARLGEIEQMLQRQRQLQRQIRSLKAARQLMGYWHTAHIPLGLTLFTAMTVHIVATIYYGALS